MAVTKIKSKKRKAQWQLIFARYYRILTWTLALALVGLSYYFILQPKYEQVGVGGQYNLDTLKNEISKRQDYVAKLDQLTANYQRINSAEVENLKKILPQQEDIAGLFVQLQAIAEKNHVLLAGVTMNEVPADPTAVSTGTTSKISKLNINVNVLGSGTNSYGEVKHFLTDIESNMRLFDVNAVYFSPDSPAYSISLYTYYYQAK